MVENYDIVIVGAGLIGASLALDLAQRSSLKIGVFERGAPLEISDGVEASNQRVVALGRPAISVLKRVGVFDLLTPNQAYPYHQMTVWDENSNGELSFNADSIGQTELGYMVDALACTKALQTNILAGLHDNLSFSFGADLQGMALSQNGAEVILADESIKARVVIGADGANSWVRRQAKIFANRLDYKQNGVVAKIKTSESHRDCAWQRFLSTGPIAALPLKDNFSSIVWSLDSVSASEVVSLSDREFKSALSSAFDYRLGNVLEVSERQMFPLLSQRADSYSAPSVVLVGDAAHSIHPLAGQGANLGFKDLDCLSDLLTSSKRGDVGSLALASHYERKRRRDNEQTDWLMSALNATFQSRLPLLLALRGVGMNAINSQEWLMSLLAQQASGTLKESELP